MCSTCNNADIVMTELAFYLNFFCFLRHCNLLPSIFE